MLELALVMHKGLDWVLEPGWQLDYYLLFPLFIPPLLFCLGVKMVVCHQSVNRLEDLPRTDEAAAFEFSFCVLMTRAPCEVAMAEFFTAISPAAVTDVKINDAVRSIEFTMRQGEAANHNDGNTCTPS